jgi:hypothetical protein
MNKYWPLTQRQPLDSSSSSSQRALSRGLDYVYLIPWVMKNSRATQDTFYKQDDPSIREEVLDSRLGASVPRVLRFFSSDFAG